MAVKIRIVGGDKNPTGRSNLAQAMQDRVQRNAAKDKAKTARETYNKAKEKTGVKGFVNRTKDWFRAVDEYSNNNPYAGYVVDPLSESLYQEVGTRPTLKSLSDQAKADRRASLDAYKAMKDAEATAAASDAYYRWTDALAKNFNNPNLLFRTTQAQIDKANTEGDKDLADKLQGDLDFYQGYYAQLQEDEKHRGWESEWDAEHMGNDTAFRRYQQQLEQNGGAETVGGVKSAMDTAKGLAEADPDRMGVAADDYDRMWSQYGDLLKQYDLYGDTQLQSVASYREAEARAKELKDQWEKVNNELEHGTDAQVINDAQREEDYNTAVQEANDHAWDMVDAGTWTWDQADAYVKRQTEIAEKRRQGAASGVIYPEARAAREQELQELNEALARAEWLKNYAYKRQYSEADNAAAYAAMSGDKDFGRYVEAGRQAAAELDTLIGEYPSEQAYNKMQEFLADGREEAAFVGVTDPEAVERYAKAYADQKYNAWQGGELRTQASELHGEKVRPDERWTAEEEDKFYWLWGKFNQEAAESYAKKIRFAHNAQDWYQDRVLHDEYFADRHPILASVLGSTGILTASYDYASMIAEGLDNNGEVIDTLYKGWSRDTEVFQQASYEFWSQFGSLSDVTGINLPDSIDLTIGEMYQAASSAMESALAMAVASGNPAVVNWLFFGAEAAPEFRRLYESGMDFEHAYASSAATGAAGAFSETINAEFLLSSAGLEFMKRGFMERLAQMGFESSEEVVGAIVDRYLDDLINGADSKYNTAYRGYRAANYSPEEARKLADQEFYDEIKQAAKMAAISTGMTQEVAMAPTRVQTAASMVTNYDTSSADSINPQALFDAAALANPDSDFAQTANRYQKRWDNRGKISNYGMGRMMDSFGRAVEQTDYQGNPEAAARVQAWLDSLQNPGQEATDSQPENPYVWNGNKEQTDAGTGTPSRTQEAAQEQPGTPEAPAMRSTEQTDSGTGTPQGTQAEEESAEESAASARESTEEQPQQQEPAGETEKTLGDTLKSAEDIVSFAQGSNENAPVAGMTQEQAKQAVIDLAKQFGLNTNKAGLKTGTDFDAAAKRVQAVFGALRNVETRRSERQAAREEAERKREEFSTLTRDAVKAVQTEDGEGQIVSANFNAKTGNTEFRVLGKDGKERVVTRSELSGDAGEFFGILEDSLGRHAAAAFNLMNDGQNVGYYATDFRQVMEYGRLSKNGNVDAILNDKNTRGVLTDAQVRLAFEIGQGMTRYEGGTPTRGLRGTGKVTLDGGVVNGQRLAAVKNQQALRNSQDFKEVVAIAKALEIDVVFYESQTDNDRYVGAQGAYQNGVIYLDVNAGMNRVNVGQRMFYRTLSHELTHFIKDNAPERYAELQERVQQYLMLETGENFGSLVRTKMARADGRLTWEAATEEVVADACETMLFNSQTVQDLAKTKPGLFDTIKGFVDRFCGQILAKHDEAKALRPIIKEVQEIWDKALKEAVENRGLAVDNPTDTVTEAEGATTNDATGSAMASLRTFDENGRDALTEFLNKRIADNALTQEEAEQMLSEIETLYKICKDYDNGHFAPFSAWSNAEVVTYDGRPVFSVVKANGEYKLNLDFSLVCKKRRTLDAVFNEMISQGIMDDFDMVQESIAKINDIIRENGFETACGLCFVDSKRYRQGMIADAFVMMYNSQVSSLLKKGQKVDYFNYGGDQTIRNSGEGIDTLADEDLNWTEVDRILKTAKPSTVKWKIANYLKNNPSARRRVRRGDFMSTAGFDALKAKNPELLSLYNSKKGAGGPKAAQSDVQYLNEIINSAAFNPKAAYEVGGVRIQSFSDYVGRLVFDYVQMTADLAAKRLPAHSYTKEYMFAQQFGLTGIKINMSLVPEIIADGVAPGLDAKGNYAWKDGQSFGSTVYDNKGKRMTAAEGFELAKKIQNADGYSRNCGTIAVGVSDEHINKMLDDPEIRMIIPYHKSSLNHIVAAMMNIDRYTDYTLQQNTREYKGGKWKNIPRSNEFSFNEALQRLGDAKAAADEYLAWCKENGYKPKFDQFSAHPNYYKVLEDYSCYDRDGKTNAPMGAVEMRFPGENDAFGSMSDLIREGLEEDAILQAKQEKAVPEIVKQIQSVLPEFEGTVRERNAKKKKAAKMSDREYEVYSRPITAQDVRALRSINGGARLSVNQFTPEDLKKTQKWAYRYYQQLGVKSPFFRAWFGEWRAADQTQVEIADIPDTVYTNKSVANYTQTKRGTYENLDTQTNGPGTGWGIRVSHKGVGNSYGHAGGGKLSLLGVSGIEGLIRNGVLLDSEVHEYHTGNAPTPEQDMVAFDHRLYALGRDPFGAVALYRITVEDLFGGHNDQNDYVFHNLRYIEKIADVQLGTGQNEAAEPTLSHTPSGQRDGVETVSSVDSTATYTVADIYRLVKQYDSEFNVNPHENVSEEYLNDDGSPKEIFREPDVYFNTDNPAAAANNAQAKSKDNIGTFDRTNPNAKLSERDDAKTDRELLMDTEGEELTKAERQELENYRAKVRDFEARERKVQAALEELDRMVREKDPNVRQQRTKVSNLQAGMNKALRELTQAETGNRTMLEIIRKEREIQRRRTSLATRETFTKRELRSRITKLYNDLNRRITRPSEKKNIPVPVMAQAVEVLQAINMDGTRPGSQSGEKFRQHLLELKEKYRALENDPDYRNAAVYDETVAELLDNMIETVGDTKINRMSAAQMQSVLEALTALDKTARTALKIKMLGEERDAYLVSKQMSEETESVKKPSKNLLATWLNASLSPERMFNRLGGHRNNSAWSQVYRMLNEGQLKQTQIQMEGTMLFDGLLDGKNYDRFIDPKNTVDIGLKDENGKVIPVTHGMMVSLYMHLQNDRNVRHIAYGGLIVPNLRDYYYGKRNRGFDDVLHAVGVSQEIGNLRDKLREAETQEEKDAIRDQIREEEAKADGYIQSLREGIERKLSAYDRQWIAAAKELFDGYSKRQLNATTLDVYGIKRANVENYFPLSVSKDFLNTPFESIAKDMSLENAGFMKSRVDSGKPINLFDVSDVARSQIRRVSQYCGLMPVVRNFQKVWGKVQTGYRGSLQEQVRDKFGTAGLQYIENLMADLNGARRKQEGPLADLFNALRGNMAQASLTLSLRTAMSQTASYPTAASVVGWKALGKALASGGKNGTILSAADRELIRKYSPLLWYRVENGSTTELGDLAGNNSKTARLWKKMRWATGWIQAMDGATVGRLWYAAQYYVEDHNKALKKGTDAYYQEVAKVFNDIVEKTQPDYTTLQRPDILRNPNALVRQLTMFLTQRLQNFNILYDSAAAYSQRKQDLKNGRATAQEVREAGTTLRRAVVSQVVAAATITAFKFLADALLHSMTAYRDDDEELTKESVSLELLDMFLDSLAGNALGGGEIYDLVEKYAFGKTYYGIDVAGVSTVTDVVEAANKFLDAALEEGATPKDVWNKGGHKLVQKISSLFGIPEANAEKIVRGMINHATDIVNGEWLRYEAGVTRTTAQQAHRLYRAYAVSNYGTAQKIREQVGDDDKLNQALTTYIKQQFKAGEINETTAITQLTKMAGKDGDKAKQMIREFKSEVETGIQYSKIAEELKAGNLTQAEAVKMWQTYGGMEREKAESKAGWTLYQDEHPNTSLEASSYATWYYKYRDILDAEQYETYYTGIKSCKGTDKNHDGKTDSGSVKVEKLKVIDSLPISDKKKDELYAANGWSMKTISDAPWRKKKRR